MFYVQTLNNIAQIGLDAFDKKKYQVHNDCSNPDAIVLRSFDMHTMTIPSSVKVIGRAGAGTNNIPVTALTKLGIPVLNTPGANANAVKELVITGMLLACRNICPAWDYARQVEGDEDSMHHQVEQDKKQFAGFELPGKTLAVIGLGSIGVKVANAAHHLGMKVIGYDPTITVRNAWELHSAVQHADKLEHALMHADFVTVHVPLNEKTQHLLDAKRITIMKRGVIILNFARDGIVDNQALLKALAEKQVRTYVCDFPHPLFKNNGQVICLPHLGASTKEAEENCAVMIAEQIQDFLENGEITNSVNFPTVKMPRDAESYRIAVINANVPNMVAQISSALSAENINIIDMINKSREEIAYTLLDVNTDVNESILNKIRAIQGVISARKV